MEKLEATLAGLIKQRCAPENKKQRKKFKFISKKSLNLSQMIDDYFMYKLYLYNTTLNSGHSIK